MADQLVEQLKATVDKLENRVNELETRLHGGSVAVKPGEGQGMRMILIGPPGAGMWRSHRMAGVSGLYLGTMADRSFQCRQGNTGTEAEGAIWLLPSGHW